MLRTALERTTRHSFRAVPCCQSCHLAGPSSLALPQIRSYAKDSRGFSHPRRPLRKEHREAERPPSPSTSPDKPDEESIEMDDQVHSSSSPIYPGSRANLRPRPHLRALFAHKPITAADIDEHLKNTAGTPDGGGTLKDLLAKINRKARNTDVEGTIDAANAIAKYKEEIGIEYSPHLPLLQVMSYHGMVEECKEVVSRISNDASFDRRLRALDWLLRAAVITGDVEEMDTTLAHINGLSNPDQEEAASQQAETGSGPNVRNFTSMTYNLLFSHYRYATQPEQALLLFAALVNSHPTASQSFISFMQPTAAESLVDLLLECQEYKLATDIAAWLHHDAGGRLLGKEAWMSLAARCAVGDYYPGLKLGWQRAVEDTDLVPDEGFIIAALCTASRHPDSALCFSILERFITRATSWTQTQEPSTSPPPVRHAHLAPVLEALAREHNFAMVYRLAGAMKYWGESVNEHSLAFLEMIAGSSREILQQALDDWQVVIDESPPREGARVSDHIETPAQRGSVIQRVCQGKVEGLRGLVETHTMNALIGAAGRLGQEDVALRFWEERRMAKRSPTLQRALGITSKQTDSKKEPQRTTVLEPTIETFIQLLNACLGRIPYPCVNLGLDIYRELTEDYPHLKVSPVIFEKLIQITMRQVDIDTSEGSTEESAPKRFDRPNHSSIPSAPSQRKLLTCIADSLGHLEQCKRLNLRPTQNSYEHMIRASLRVKGDIRWKTLLEEMKKEAKYKIPVTLKTYLYRVDLQKKLEQREADVEEGLEKKPLKEYHGMGLPSWFWAESSNTQRGIQF